MAGTSASMAPGYEGAERLKELKSRQDYWAKAKAKSESAA